jgi:hypothetical protein
VDGNGENFEIDELVWRGAFVSAFLRHQRTPVSACFKAGCVQNMELLQSPDQER